MTSPAKSESIASSPRSANPFDFLLGSLFGATLLIQTVGRVPGLLIPVASLCALPLIFCTLWAFRDFGRSVGEELSSNWKRLFWGLVAIQAFWAFFRAPLDVDGLFYHLPIILEALEKNTWGDWSYRVWQVQSTSKGADIPNLCLIALGGDVGYRFAQFGHFSSGILGALAFASIARSCQLRKPALFGLVYLFTPIVMKQMSANYVDMAFYSYWLACAALALRIMNSSSSAGRMRDWLLLGFAAFLLVGAKMNGFVSFFAITPLLVLVWRSENKRSRFYFGALGVGALSALSASFWMLPNWREWQNPLFPIQPGALLPNSGLKLVPDQIPLTYLNGWVGRIDVPDAIRWLLQFFAFEPTAQYDICGGAWGFIGTWAIAALATKLFAQKGFQFRRPNFRSITPLVAFYICLVLSFFGTPGRITPRYAILGGFLFIFPALVLLVRDELSPLMKKAFLVAVLFQVPYVAAERVLFRGVTGLPVGEATAAVAENFRDVVRNGEPQHPERWVHSPYVPELRKQEPREVVVGADCVDLVALYWGRHFANRVRILPECARWPYLRGE